MTAPARASGFYRFTIGRPVATTMLMLAVATFGFISAGKIPLELLPEITYPSITIRTTYQGAGPEDVEERVSKKIEEALAVLPGLVGHSSISRSGVSEVLLEFQWETPLLIATQEVRERLDRTDLPSEVEPPLILRYDPSTDPVLRLSVSGDRDQASLRLAAEDIIGKGLSTVPGVAAIKVRGGLETEIRVQIDSQKLSQLGLDISEVDRRLKIENINLASGKLIEGDTEYLVRTLNQFEDLDEILDLAITQRDGQPVRVKDVAQVVRTHKERDVITRVDGRESVELLVFREADANITDLASAVREKLFGTDEERALVAAIAAGRVPDPEAELQRALLEAEQAEPAPAPAPGKEGQGMERPHESEKVQLLRAQVAKVRAARERLAALLPRGIETRVLSDQSVFIAHAIDEVKGAGWLGGLLSVVVLLLFLKNLRTTSILSLSIPLSVIATFAPMYLLGTSLNIMSLGGLALGIGMLVDDSIVVLESITRCREEGDSWVEGAVRGTSEVGMAVTASTLTTVAVFFPIAFVSGVAGQIFRDQALTVVFSVLSSLAVAILLIPMLASRGRGGTARGVDVLRRPFAFAATVAAPLALPQRLLAIRSLRSTLHEMKGWRAALIPVPLLIGVAHALTEWIGRLLIALIAVAVGLAVAGAGGVIAVAKLVGWPIQRAFEFVYGGFERAYPRVLRAVLTRPLLIAGVLLASGAALWWSIRGLDHLGSEMLPEVHQGELVVHLYLPIGTPVERTAETMAPIEAALRALPEVSQVAASIGVARDDLADPEEGSHSARLLLRLRSAGADLPSAERARIEQKTLEEIRGVVARRAELTGFRFSRPTLFSIKSPLEIQARGNDLAELRDAAAELTAGMVQSPRITDVRSTVSRGNPEVHLTFDREKLLRFGLDIEAISNRVRAQVQGVVSTRFAEGDRRIDVRVQSNIDTIDKLLDLTVNRGRAVDLADTLDRGSEGGGGSSGTGSTRSRDRTFFPGTAVDLGSSAAIPLRQVADIRIVEGPSEIRRINGQRAAVVTAAVSGFDVGAAIDSVRGVLDKVEARHPDLICAVGGQGAEMGEAMNSMRLATLLAIFLVYLVMAAQFESIVQPLIILLTIPLALVGMVLSLRLTSTPLSVVALIGAIVLAGIVVKNAIVMLDYTNQLRARGLGVVDALVESAQARLRPILMTTLTTVLGLVPLTGVLERIPGVRRLPAFLWTGSELQAPLAITVIGGLTLSTALTLLVIPAVYRLVVGRTPTSRLETPPPVL